MQIRTHHITFVIQGPIVEQITAKACKAIRTNFPNACILVSTWKNQPLENLDYDELLLNDDPGSSVVKFTKKNEPHRININRQIRSTIKGLRKVETPYAVKLRSDNVLSSNKILALYSKFPASKSPLIPLESRILTTNLFAKEFTEGLPTPFFFSDFFMFGKTSDLINFWDQPYLEDYTFRKELTGKRQHSAFPWPQLHIEQWLVLNFLKKHIPVELNYKYQNNKNQLNLSRKVLAKHFLVAERCMIDLEVPDRLNQHEGFPYETYSFARWETLYKRFDDAQYQAASTPLIKLLWLAGRVIMYLKSGLKQQVRLMFCYTRETFSTHKKVK